MSMKSPSSDPASSFLLQVYSSLSTGLNAQLSMNEWQYLGCLCRRMLIALKSAGEYFVAHSILIDFKPPGIPANLTA
jgi:hypothetical protein